MSRPVTEPEIRANLRSTDPRLQLRWRPRSPAIRSHSPSTTSSDGPNSSTPTGWPSSTSPISPPSRGTRSPTGRWGRRAKAIAAGLDALGIGIGDRVAMVSQNSARLLTALFGVSGSGRVLVPINFRLVAEEVRYIVEHSGAQSAVRSILELADSLADIECEHRFAHRRRSGCRHRCASGSSPSAWAVDEDATATINYTSGTTARPKGVQLTHRNLWLNASIFGWHMAVSDRDVYLHTPPQFHCNGWGMLYAVTGMGGRHVILRKVDGMEILRRIEQHGVTLMCGAPAVLNVVLDAAATWKAETGRPVPDNARVAHRRRRCSPSDPDDRAHRDRTRTGVRPDLRPHRDHAADHDEPHPRRVRRPVARRPRREAQPGRSPRGRLHDGGRRRGRDPRAATW